MSERPWWRRRWVIILACVVFALVAVRVALPLVLRSVLVSQGNALLAGRFTVEDVDLWLLQGAVAIDGVELRGDDAPTVGSDAPAAAPSPDEPVAAAAIAPSSAPRVAFRRLLVDIRWWPLLSRTVYLEEITLDGPEIEVERQPDGSVLVPQLRPPAVAPEAAPEPEAPAAEPGQPWNVIVGAARLRDGKLELVDRVATPPRTVDLTLDGLEVLGFRLLHDSAEEEPGKGTIEARFGDGTVRLEASLATRTEGFAITANLDIENVPLDRLNVHAPQIGWSDFRGRLDGKIEIQIEPNALPVVSGTAALRDVQVDVPGEDEPALAWRRFDVDVERLDLTQRSVAVRRVALEGAGVLVRPRSVPPLPLLPRPAAAADGQPASAQAADAAGEEPAEDSAEQAPLWSWSVATVEVSDSMVKLFLEPPALEIGIVAVKVEGLSSVAGNRASAMLEVREGPATVTVAGDFALDPLAARAQVKLDALALERFAAAAGVTPPVLRRGNLGADLKLAFGDGPAIVSGTVALAELDVAPPEGDDFALGWTRLEIGIREVRLPGILPGPGAPAGSPIKVDLARIALAAPKIRLTRTADGIVLPVVSVATGGAEQGAGADPGAAAAAAPAPAEPSPAAAPLELTVDELTIDAGEVTILDRTVQPFFRGRLAAIELDAKGLAYPSNRFRDVHLTAQAPGGTPLEVRAQQKGTAIDVTIDAKGLALPQLNPYVTGAAGYSIASGTFTLASKLRWGEDGYQSESALAFDDLDVAGAEGDALFAQRFGVSLSLALALMRDVSGRIALTVPVSGDRSGSVRPDIAPIVAEALSRALINALASPLKLLGALSLDGEKVAAFAPQPVAFAVGRADVDDEAWWRVEQLTNVLAASPALRVELTGTAGSDDVRALQEAAVLADLQADQGVLASLRNLPRSGTRSAIRDALAARAQGEAVMLEPDEAAQLEEWVAAKTISDENLRALATARQQRLRDVLVTDYGVAADRIGVRDPAPDPATGTAQVRVAIAARS